MRLFIELKLPNGRLAVGRAPARRGMARPGSAAAQHHAPTHDTGFPGAVHVDIRDSAHSTTCWGAGPITRVHSKLP